MNFDKQLDVFSRNLSEIRRNGRYSYQAFSEKLRVGKSTVQAIESGDYNITLSTLITIANSLEIHPALLLMDLPIELDLTGTNRYYANLLMTYSALPEEQRSQFRNIIQRLECSLDGDHLEQNDTGVICGVSLPCLRHLIGADRAGVPISGIQMSLSRRCHSVSNLGSLCGAGHTHPALRILALRRPAIIAGHLSASAYRPSHGQ